MDPARPPGTSRTTEGHQPYISASYLWLPIRPVLEKTSADVVVVGYVDLRKAGGLVGPRLGGARWAASEGECEVASGG